MRRNLDHVTGALTGKRAGNKWCYECPVHPAGEHLIVREMEGKEVYHFKLAIRRDCAPGPGGCHRRRKNPPAWIGESESHVEGLPWGG